MSALVARELSGVDRSQKGGDETNKTATRGAEDAFRGGLGRLSENEPVTKGSGASQP